MTAVDKLRAVVEVGNELGMIASNSATGFVDGPSLTHGDLRSLLARIDDLEDPDKNPLREEIRDLHRQLGELQETITEACAAVGEGWFAGGLSLADAITRKTRVLESVRWPGPDQALTAREAARRRQPLDGADAQALEGALRLTERERDEARALSEERRRALEAQTKETTLQRERAARAEAVLVRVADLVREAHRHWDSILWPEDKRYVAMLAQALAILSPRAGEGEHAHSHPLPWRVGRSVGRTLYDASDQLVGMVDTPELAAQIVAAVNATASVTSTALSLPPGAEGGAVTLADVCDELEAALEHERETRDWWTMQRLLRALVALGEHELEDMWSRPVSASESMAAEHDRRLALEDRFSALKARAQEVLGG